NCTPADGAVGLVDRKYRNPRTSVATEVSVRKVGRIQFRREVCRDTEGTARRPRDSRVSVSSIRASPICCSRRFRSFRRHRCNKRRIPCFDGQSVPVRLGFEYFSEDLGCCISSKRSLSTKHFIEYASECPHICRAADLLSAGLIWRHKTNLRGVY